MLHKKLFTIACLLSATIAKAQSTDPMLTEWWFNTTNATYNGILTNVEAVYYDTTYVYVHASGVPSYYVSGYNVNSAMDLDATWQIPRNPQPAATPIGIQGGQEGLFVDGSVFFHPGDAQSYNNAGVWNRLAYFFEINDMDPTNGHSTPNHWYHHHFDNLALHTWDSTVHSSLIGFAWDGYPIYGPYGYANINGTGGIKRMTSSYTTYTYTTRTNGPDVSSTYPIGCFIEDWYYTAGSGTLDAHNGRFCVTPEYPAGTYAYFTTVDNTLKPVYPYFIGPTYYGSFTNTNIGPNGGTVTYPADTTRYYPSTTSVNQVSAIGSDVTIYPIPVTDDLNIQLNQSGTYAVVLYDVKGTVLIKENITASAKLPMSDLPYGVYFVQVENLSAKTGFAKRIVKL